MTVHVFPILTPPRSPSPSNLLGSSQSNSHDHPATCIKPGLAICFNAILSNHPTPPSPTESNSLFFPSVSFLMSAYRVIIQFSSVQSLSHVRLCDPMNRAHQASLSITNSWSSLRLTSIESVMPSSHLIFCRPHLLLPPIPPSIRVFSNESTLPMRWPKY